MATQLALLRFFLQKSHSRCIAVAFACTCALAFSGPAHACSIASGYSLASEHWEEPEGPVPDTPRLHLSRLDRGELEQGSRSCGYIAVLEIELPDHSDEHVAGYFIRVTGDSPRGMYVPDSLLLPQDRDDRRRVFWFSWPEIVFETGVLPQLDFEFEIVAVSKLGQESDVARLRIRSPE